MTEAAPRVLLIGMMGSGKSSVGAALAARTGWPFIDNDALVEDATGMTAKQLLRDAGEAALRSAEARAFERGLTVPAPSVVGVAGGVVLHPDLRARLAEGGFVVWLHASPAVLAARAQTADHRPWLEADPLAWFERTVRDRGHLYADVADLTIDTGATDPTTAADAILRHIRGDEARVPSDA